MNWRDSRHLWVKAFSDLPLVGVRGPQSEGLLREAGLRNVVISGDPCVLLHERVTQPRPVSSPLRLVLNLGSTRAIWGDNERFRKEVMQFVISAKAEGWALSLLPVYPSDREACDRAVSAAGLPPSAVLPMTTDHPGFLDAMSKTDVLIAFKLHAGVLAAAANVPFVMLEYRPKCRDFTSSIDWEGYTVTTSEVTADRLLTMVRDMGRERVRLQEHLCVQMCRLRSVFDSYCRDLRPLLDAHFSRAASLPHP